MRSLSVVAGRRGVDCCGGGDRPVGTDRCTRSAATTCSAADLAASCPGTDDLSPAARDRQRRDPIKAAESRLPSRFASRRTSSASARSRTLIARVMPELVGQRHGGGRSGRLRGLLGSSRRDWDVHGVYVPEPSSWMPGRRAEAGDDTVGRSTSCLEARADTIIARLERSGGIPATPSPREDRRSHSGAWFRASLLLGTLGDGGNPAFRPVASQPARLT
jgi:hypothetical protein